MRIRVRSLWLVAMLACVPPLVPASALPLDQSTCGELDKEKGGLESAGVLTDMRLKPGAAKALGQDHLKRIERYVEISGQVLFRCSSLVPRVGDTADQTKQPAAKSASVQPPERSKPAPVKVKKRR